ncbi:MAG: DUF5667 domain-containing protein [Patescibacteria group bacterium]
MNKLLKQLKQLKHEPRFATMNAQAVAKSWDRIAAAIGAQEPAAQPLPSAAVMYFEYLKWNLGKYLSKPAMAGAFSVVVIASGWMTTVRAADSLPGQRLYSVKMITEKAQLKLASLDRKAVLHTEFAGRRLQEASDLQDASEDILVSAPLVKEAIAAYKQEVASAGENLRQLKDEGSETVLATATSVQRQLQANDSNIDNVVADSDSPEATQDALDAKIVTQEVSGAATTIAVEVHEELPSDLSAYELKQMFKSGLGQIEARQRFDLERIEVIRAALADESVSYDSYNVPTDADLLAFEYPIVAVDSLLSHAMSSFGIGGYRSAFATLREIDDSLLGIEAQLAQIEITIMTARQQPIVVEAEPVTDTKAESL